MCIRDREETKGMFIDILPELPPDEGVARVSFYLDDTYDVEETLKTVSYTHLDVYKRQPYDRHLFL